MVANWRLKIPFSRGTIRPTPDSDGHVLHTNLLKGRDIESEMTMRDRDRMERHVIGLLAGNKAVHVLCGIRAAKTDGFHDDFHNAVNLITYFASSNEEVQAYFSWLEIRARGLVGLHKELIRRTAVVLMEKKELSRLGLKKIIEAQFADFVKTPIGKKGG
jgi:hypothetical protein